MRRDQNRAFDFWSEIARPCRQRKDFLPVTQLKKVSQPELLHNSMHRSNCLAAVASSIFKPSIGVCRTGVVCHQNAVLEPFRCNFETEEFPHWIENVI